MRGAETTAASLTVCTDVAFRHARSCRIVGGFTSGVFSESSLHTLGTGTKVGVQTCCIERGNVLCMQVLPSYVGHTVMIQTARELEHACAAFVWINICAPERNVSGSHVSLLLSLYLNLI